jgi:NAD+ synthase (glutamine-hydrolysing)
MKLIIHQTHQTIGDFKAIKEKIFEVLKSSKEGLHLFPELYLCGYPLQDLCLQRTFIQEYLSCLKEINEFSKKLKLKEVTLLMGGLRYEFDESGLPLKIENVIYSLSPSKELKWAYTKRLLPYYDIFDEKKYFTPGSECTFFNFMNKNIALMICEDMWPSNAHPVDPAEDILKKTKKKLDLVINLSASPFNLGKDEQRKERGKEISNLLGAPFVYVNRVGAEDEILFDGSSFFLDGNQLLWQGKSFAEDLGELELPKVKRALGKPSKTNYKGLNTWESLFSPTLSLKGKNTVLTALSQKDCEQTLSALNFGISDYALKNGFKNFSVALSGGLDSALVLTILKLGLKKGQKLEAIFMPGLPTSSLSFELCEKLCEKLNVPLKIFPIKFVHKQIQNAFKEYLNEELTGLSDENIQSRLRGSIIYARSNQTQSMVLNTSNKSELAVGYSTLYGDSVGALSVLGDLYKTEVFALAEYINREFKNLIPPEIISRPPTAELRPGQVDSDSLPPYEILDAILEGLLSYRLGPEDLVKLNFSKKDVSRVYNLYQKSEFKRYQFCPIIKIKSKSFGFGYRIPICKTWGYK